MNSVYGKKIGAFQIIMLIFCLLLILLTLFPMLNVLAVSMSGKNAIAKGNVGIIPQEFTMEAYQRVFSNNNIMHSMLYSIGLTVGVALLSTFMTILAAYPLSKPNLKGKHFFLTLVTLTMVISAGTIPNYLLIKELGLINTVWALVLPAMITPFNLIILRTFFTGINKSIFEAAEIDGCGQWRSMFVIAIPLSLPSIFTVMLFYAVARWNGVTDVIYYVNTNQLYTLQYQLKLILDTISIDYSKDEAEVMLITPENIKSSAIIFSVIPMLIIYPFVQRCFTKGVMIGGVKE